MAFPFDVKEMWAKAFRQSGTNTKISVGIEGDTGLLEGVSYDDIVISYPTNSTELYTYFKNAVQVAAIEVTYSNSSKNILIRARRV